MKKILSTTKEGTGHKEMQEGIVKLLELHLQRAREEQIEAIFIALIGKPLPEHVASGVADPEKTCGTSGYIGPEEFAATMVSITKQAISSTLMPVALKYAISTGQVELVEIPVGESPEDSSGKDPAQSPVH